MGADPNSGHGNIYGHIAASYDNHIGSDVNRPVRIDALQELEPVENARQIRAFQIELPAYLQTDGNKDRLVALALQVIQIHILTEGHIQPELHPFVQNPLDLLSNKVFWEPVIGETGPEHAAGCRSGFEDGNLIAVPHQVQGRRQTGRTRTDNSNFMSLIFLSLVRPIGFFVRFSLSCKDLLQLL